MGTGTAVITILHMCYEHECSTHTSFAGGKQARLKERKKKKKKKITERNEEWVPLDEDHHQSVQANPPDPLDLLLLLIMKSSGGILFLSAVLVLLALALRAPVGVSGECIRVKDLSADPGPGDLYQFGGANFTVIRSITGIIQSPGFPDPMTDEPQICRWVITGQEGEKRLLNTFRLNIFIPN